MRSSARREFGEANVADVLPPLALTVQPELLFEKGARAELPCAPWAAEVSDHAEKTNFAESDEASHKEVEKQLKKPGGACGNKKRWRVRGRLIWIRLRPLKWSG